MPPPTPPPLSTNDGVFMPQSNAARQDTRRPHCPPACSRRAGGKRLWSVRRVGPGLPGACSASPNTQSVGDSRRMKAVASDSISSQIMSAIRKPAVAATDNGPLAPELAAGIARGKSAKSIRRQVRQRLTLRQVSRLCAAPVRGGGAHRWALFGRIHAGGDGRRTAREYGGAVGMVTESIALAISDRASSRDLRVLGGGAWRVVPAARVHHARAKQG